MLSHFIFSALLLFTVSTEAQDIPESILLDVSYGFDHQQIMDIYLPAGRNKTTTKVIFMIHGGGWSGGSKHDMDGFLGWFWPEYAIVNIEYRLASPEDPAYPKQLQDITMALSHLRARADTYQINTTYAFLGASAGAHLSMLYGCMIDKSQEIKAIGNYVGPTDITDPAYDPYLVTRLLFLNLVGNHTIDERPDLYREVSPVFHVSPDSPKTISFYGGQDVLIPSISQATLLREKMNEAGVTNADYLYPEEGHGFVDQNNLLDMHAKMTAFFRSAFNA